MGKTNHFLWIGGIFDENTIKNFLSISPAANFWQRGFADALQSHGNTVDVIGHPVERVWPFGRLVISRELAKLPTGFAGKAVGYLNAPFIRGPIQYLNYMNAAMKQVRETGKKPDYLITFSCITKSTDWTSTAATARYLRKRFGVPWICIVGDGMAPPGADGYVYNAWSYFDSPSSLSPKIFLDGGVPIVRSDLKHPSVNDQARQAKILMFMGALTPHAGASWLSRSFHLLPDEDIELWISGRGENPELRHLAEIDKRIRLIGFVSEEELTKLAERVNAFVNPRPSDFEPNKLNYPSKLLHYFAYGKPVISTLTAGVSPEYQDALIPVREETDECLAETIHKTLNMSETNYASIRARISNFNATHTWVYQVNRFNTWLQNGL